MIVNGMVLTERSSKSDLKRPQTDPIIAFLLCLHLRAQRLSLANPLAPRPQQAAGSQPNEVDLVMKGLLAQPGVTAYLIINADGTCRHRRAPWVERLRLTERARDLRACTHRAGVRPAEPPHTYTRHAQHTL